MEIWENVVRMVSALGVVLALILGLLAVVKSRVGQRFLPVGGAPLVKVLGSGSLGARKNIVLVAVAGEVLIVGTTATDLIALGKVTDPEQVKRLLVDTAASSAIPPSGLAPSEYREEAAHAAR